MKDNPLCRLPTLPGWRTLALAMLIPLCACLPAAAQGLDRAVGFARTGILKRFPDENLDNLRLKQIELMDRNSISGRTYRVEFEDVSSIFVSTREGVRTRSIRLVRAQVAPDGRVSSVTESAPSSIRKAKP